ncbi:uncharacterized protein METZ01_LOCUS138669 [marine metagenome]|uniref:Uncharacterized protein n=1 Tax=marine metagenome TaxID=408172 RepID=A0A381Z925_9ZZZZ
MKITASIFSRGFFVPLVYFARYFVPLLLNSGYLLYSIDTVI